MVQRISMMAMTLVLSAAYMFAADQQSLPLDQALNRLFDKTDVRVADRRSDRTDEPKVRVELDKGAFWPTVDAIAREANLRVSVHEPDRKVALRDGPWIEQPLCYQGPFRVCMKRLKTVRDWEAGTSDHVAIVETSWHDGFVPMILEMHPGDTRGDSEAGKPLAVKDGSVGRYSVAMAPAGETTLRFEAAPRRTQQLASVRGRVQVIGSRNLLKFRFEDLAKLKEGQKLERDGVQVIIEQADFDDDLWTIRISTEYPTQGPGFESFENWLIYHRFALHASDGSKVLSPDDGAESSARSHSATITYRLSGDALREAKKRKLTEWNLEVCCPGRFETHDVPFEFKNVPLP